MKLASLKPWRTPAALTAFWFLLAAGEAGLLLRVHSRDPGGWLLVGIALLGGLACFVWVVAVLRSPDTLYRSPRAVAEPRPLVPADEDRALRDQMKSLLWVGRRIDAIKAYRDATGAGLKEAVDAVDVVQREIRG